MAQHDYNIANQSGADFRADLNNALGAIATTNSGATEPSTTYAHQLWVDTSSNVLKIRNGTDSAWITTGISITTSNILTGDLTGNVTGNLTGNVTGNVTGDLTGNADTATTLATARTISLSGDVAGSASFDGSGDITITTTAQIDSIALGTDTTGDYVESMSGGTGVTVTGGTGEGSTPSIAIGQAVATTDDVTFNTITATDQFIGDVRGAVRFNASADGALSKGDVVYISGVSGNTPTVAKAKADDASKMPAFGFAASDANDNAAVEVVTFGTLTGLDTSGVSVGQVLYVSTTAGAYTTTAPSGESSQIQNIGKVQRSHATTGSIKVGGAGRSNATPNLNDGKIFIGNASNQSSTATLDTSIVVENTNLYYTTARANSAIDARVTNTFINNLTGVVADTATALATARTISLSGDIAGSASFDGTSDITITSTIQPNSIALGTDTVGNYVQTITGTANKITVTGSGSESADVTLTLPDDVQIADSLTVAGNLTVNGTLVSLDTTNLDIADNLFQLNAGLTGSPVNDSGMLINRGNQNNGIFMWDESVDKFTLGLTTADGTTTGNITLSSLGTLVANLEGAVTGNVTGTVSSISNHSTSDLSEGTNLYYTDARFDTRLATKSTSDLAEGSNLYYTDARVQAVSINNVVEDTTPQLGGDLDLNSSNITGTGNINITGTITSSGNITGTLATAAQPNITSVGTLTGLDVAGTPTFDGLTVDGTGQITRLGLGVAPHATAGLNITTTNQHIRLNNGSELGIIHVLSTGELELWGHGDGESINFRTGSGAGTVAMNIVGDKVGITNTSTLNANLHIGSASATGDTTNPALQIGGATTYRLGMYTSTEGGVIENKNGDDGIQFRVKTAGEAMRIDGGTGNVGISTSSPSYKLDVDGDINIGDGSLRLETTSSGFPSTGLVHFSNNFLYQRGGSNGIIFSPAGGGSEIARFTGAGRVGIGNDNPTAAKLEVKGAKTQSGGAPIGNVLIADSTSLAANTGGGITFQGVYQTGGAITGFASIEAMKETSTHNEYGGALVFKSRQDQGSMNEGMRLTSTGDILVGKTAANISTDGIELGTRIESTADGTYPLRLNRRNSDGEIVNFRKDGATVGTISVTSSATAYNTSSDARLKDITGEAKGLEVINKLNPVAYNWKEDGKADEGLIAQEVQEIVPNAVSQNQEEYYQMDYSKLVTPLIKAVQELSNEVNELKKEIQNLKG
jgi:hypothetical protein